MNRKKMATALGIALLVSGLCTFLLARQMGSKKRSSAVTDEQYVAAAKDIAAGSVVKAEDVKMINWPSSVPLNGGFRKSQDVVGRTVLSLQAADTPILNQSLAPAGAGVGLSTRIPDGMRAISLKSDEIVGVSGFLFPGSHVDVLVTYRNPNSPDPVTATVLQNVEVLAAGSKIAADPDGKPAKVDEVTLLLSPVDAGKAVLASSQGTIHFVLRNGSDSAQEQDTTVGMAMLGGAAAVKEVTKVPHAPIYRKTVDQASVITVSGDKSAVSNFSTTK